MKLLVDWNKDHIFIDNERNLIESRFIHLSSHTGSGSFD